MSFTRLAIALLSLALPLPLLAQDAAQPALLQRVQSAECSCRAQGRVFAVGEKACLRSADGPRLAQCGMVLNNTSWRFTAETCPET